MRFTRLASLSSVAAMLLHCGTFVAANPTFTPHSNDGSQDIGQCQDFQVTYPVGEGLRFVENTNHLIAWQAPDFISNVNITLAKADQTPVAVIGTFEASRGVSGEVPILLNGQEPGEYHFHLEGIGMNCQADSSTFQVTNDSQQQSDSQEEANNKMINAIAGATHQDSPYFTNEDRRTHVDQRLSDELYQLQQEHDNAAGWSAQEIDPIQAEEEVEPAAEHNNDGDFEEEHSNADQWQTEEIDDTDDEPVHQDAVGWTDGHENIEGFQQEEIDVNDEQPSNGNDWTEGHDNDAHASGWTDGHENVEGFQEEEIDINSDESNGQAAGWTEQHSNDAHATGWTDGHENVEGFQEEEIDINSDESNGQAAGWTEQHSNDAHATGWTDGHENVEGFQEEEIDIEQDESSSHENDNHATGWTEEHDNDAPTATGWVDGHENAGASDNNEPAWTAEKIANPVVGHTDAVENWSAEALEQENEPSGKVSTGYLPSSGSSGATSGAASHTNGNTIPVLPAEALIANW